MTAYLNAISVKVYILMIRTLIYPDVRNAGTTISRIIFKIKLSNQLRLISSFENGNLDWKESKSKGRLRV